MDKIIKYEKSSLSKQLNEAERSYKQKLKSIDHLRKSADTEFNRRSIEKNLTDISKLELRMENMISILKKLEGGIVSPEMMDAYEARKVLSDVMYSKDQQKLVLKKAKAKVFRKVDELIEKEPALPKHLQIKLRDMPANEGFIVNGKHYHGERPAEEGKNMVLLEQKRENGEKVLYTHETRADGKYWKFKKIGDGPRKCIQTISVEKKRTPLADTMQIEMVAKDSKILPIRGSPPWASVDRWEKRQIVAMKQVGGKGGRGQDEHMRGGEMEI